MKSFTQNAQFIGRGFRTSATDFTARNAGYAYSELNCNSAPLNGHLITLNTSAIYNFTFAEWLEEIEEPGEGDNKYNTWIGLHPTDDSTTWEWYTTPWKNLSFVTWFGGGAHNQPPPPGVCVWLRSKPPRLWQVCEQHQCDYLKPYICEADPDTSIHSKSPAELFPDCPYGYTHTYNNSCYNMSYGTVEDWFKAEETCQCQGGHLASIHDEDEFQWMRKETTLISGNRWIGLTNYGNSYGLDTYWSDGTPVVLDKWNKAKNNHFITNATLDICAATVPYWRGVWRRYPCTQPGVNAICEIPKYQPSKREFCLLKSHTDYTNLFDGNEGTCEQPIQFGLITLVEINQEMPQQML